MKKILPAIVSLSLFCPICDVHAFPPLTDESKIEKPTVLDNSAKLEIAKNIASDIDDLTNRIPSYESKRYAEVLYDISEKLLSILVHKASLKPLSAQLDAKLFDCCSEPGLSSTLKSAEDRYAYTQKYNKSCWIQLDKDATFKEYNYKYFVSYLQKTMGEFEKYDHFEDSNCAEKINLVTQSLRKMYDALKRSRKERNNTESQGHLHPESQKVGSQAAENLIELQTKRREQEEKPEQDSEPISKSTCYLYPERLTMHSPVGTLIKKEFATPPQPENYSLLLFTFFVELSSCLKISQYLDTENEKFWEEMALTADWCIRQLHLTKEEDLQQTAESYISQLTEMLEDRSAHNLQTQKVREATVVLRLAKRHIIAKHAPQLN